MAIVLFPSQIGIQKDATTIHLSITLERLPVKRYLLIWPMKPPVVVDHPIMTQQQGWWWRTTRTHETILPRRVEDSCWTQLRQISVFSENKKSFILLLVSIPNQISWTETFVFHLWYHFVLRSLDSCLWPCSTLCDDLFCCIWVLGGRYNIRIKHWIEYVIDYGWKARPTETYTNKLTPSFFST